METETRTTRTLRDLLLARVRFLALVAVTFALVGIGAHALEVAHPYPEHPFVTEHAPVEPVR